MCALLLAILISPPLIAGTLVLLNKMARALPGVRS
jgi:hypothetical protein